ncbi:hypothetical protein N9L47_06700 [Rhodobacteraceae bacterium]|nr:hypothetical protein [Paracoccaceae bacterium]
MIQPIIILVGVSAAFLLSNALIGHDRSFAIGYGALALMAAMVSLTFLWLWARRATPLAIGMFFGWAGAASVIGWWWMFYLQGNPHWMVEAPVPFIMLSVYFVGAILHFKVIWQSFGLTGSGYLIPVGVSLALSVLAQFTI